MESSVRLGWSHLCSIFLLITQCVAYRDGHIEAEPFIETRAREIVNLTQAAYCVDQLVGWNCTVCASFPGMKNVSVLHGLERNVRGFIGIDVGDDFTSERQSLKQQQFSRFGAEVPSFNTEEDAVSLSLKQRLRDPDNEGAPSSKRIVITFAGTDPKSFKNWMDDLEAELVPHSYRNGTTCVDCKVHDGFLATYGVVKEEVRVTVARHLLHNPTAEVLITGHSLGGALATLCFLDLLDTIEGVSFAPLYIFGAPRVGNGPFATYTASHGVPIYRLVHYRDPVPHLPPWYWGYVHPPREIFFDYEQESYVICDDSGEDPGCCAQFWALPSLAHIADHLNYLEVDYTTSYIKCVLGPVPRGGRGGEGMVDAGTWREGAGAAVLQM